MMAIRMIQTTTAIAKSRKIQKNDDVKHLFVRGKFD
jgi:hypothetical protein